MMKWATRYAVILFFFPLVIQPVHNMLLISTELCTLNEALNKIFYENKNE